LLVGYLSLTDLFLVGLALDISGATLLAKGLLLSPRELARLNTFWGVGYGQHEDRCRNRVAGEFGVAYLVCGFLLQAVGYLLAVSGVPSEAGSDRVAAALVLALVVAGVAWAAWALLHRPRIDALVAAIEREGAAASQEINEVEQRTQSRSGESLDNPESMAPPT
jgi:hypothetical protein